MNEPKPLVIFLCMDCNYGFNTEFAQPVAGGYYACTKCGSHRTRLWRGQKELEIEPMPEEFKDAHLPTGWASW